MYSFYIFMFLTLTKKSNDPTVINYVGDMKHDNTAHVFFLLKVS